MSNWFTTREVGPRTWAIDDNRQDTIYLIEGGERSLLLDTGWGVGDLAGLVRAISRKPLVVVNSHGHPDHALGDYQFGTVHIHAADVRTVESYYRRRQDFADGTISKIAPAGFDLSKWAATPPTLSTVEPGHVFDLGGRSLEVLPIAGHSPGSICLLDRGNRMLFTGDSILAGVIWMYLDESTSLRQYEASLKSIREQAGAWDTILPAHGTTPITNAVLDDLIAGVGEILSGRMVGRPERTFIGEGLRCDFTTTGIIYNPDRLE